MNKNTILKIAPYVLKRMEYGINIFYLLNLENDEIWTGNYASYIIISEIDGIKSIEKIIKNSQEKFLNYTYEEIYSTTIPILKELVNKKFLIIIK